MSMWVQAQKKLVLLTMINFVHYVCQVYFYVIFIDSEGIPTLRCNVRALQDNTYRLAGEMLSTMTGQGGPLPQMFDSSAVKYMVTGVVETNPKVEDMPRVIGEALNQVCKGLYKVH